MPQHSNAVTADILRGFDDFLARRGVAAEPMRQQFALPSLDQTDTERELPFDRVAQLLEHAAIACGDPNLGLAYAKEYPVGGMGILAFLFLNSRTVEDALQTVVKYVPLLRIPFKFSFKSNHEGGCIQWRPTDEVSLDYKQIYEFGAALLMIRLRSLLPANWQPVRVELQCPVPTDTTALELVFGPSITYSATVNAIWVSAETLAHEIPMALPKLREILEKYGEQEIAGKPRADDRIVEATRRSMLKLMGERRFSLDDVAADLRMPARTLQNRLAAIGTTFEEVLNDTRKARAEQLMQSPQYSLTEIAYKLGFSEPSAFTRAAQRWFGRAPSVQRQLLLTKMH